ncbi:MAG: hypothetical protein WCF16_11200 [Alphaproteobacteria bacterium]
MRKILLTAIAFLALCSAGYGAEKLRFWNLTIATVTHLYLAPAGSDKWGKDQCENDPDKSVDSDERLLITDVEPGRYDVKLTDKLGRTCLVRNVEVKGGKPYAFSIEENELKDCKK